MAVSAVFGIVLVQVSAPAIKRATERINRAFFRGGYDARVILQDLAEKTREVTDRRELASLLARHIEGALSPKTFTCYLLTDDSHLVAEWGRVAPQLQTISATLPLLTELVLRGKSWGLAILESNGAKGIDVLCSLAPECLVPILGRDNRLVGLLVLGQRQSEEPYSGEDKSLLDSIASQAGMALESIRLAEKMAERMEAERRVAQEMEIAHQVQARLFPQRMPLLATLEYAGACIPAQRVGGDYYDFLDLGPGRLGIVLADISGKGISGALLMASLQANLRSQCTLALQDLPGLLRSVNRLFYENTPEDCYATLFIGTYDDVNRQLRYANCGHNPPLLLRADGTLERPEATATVLGLFPGWKGAVREVFLCPGDTLVAYTDGITESSNIMGQEFGEAGLIQAIQAQRQLSPNAHLTNIIAAVREFSGGAQVDDMALVVAVSR